MDKLTMRSVDLTGVNIERIAQLFPNVITEVKSEDGSLKKAIDFELLKQELSDDIVDGEKERYQLIWPGKKEAILLANTPIDKTLRPKKDDSVDWENTENIYIEGDNLEALKLLQESYLNKIKCIYIDPPYNTGKDFIYKDDFKQTIDEYLEESGQVDEAGNRLFQNNESNGRFHSDWLTMMYSRLKLARNLLCEDGSIIVHIDEHEMANLQKILDEIFGIENNLGVIIWDKGNPKGDATGVAYQHEVILVYSKSIECFCQSNPLMRPKKNAVKILNKAKELLSKNGKQKLPDDIANCIKKYKIPDEVFSSLRYTVTLDDINEEFISWLKNQDFSGGESAYSKIDENDEVYQSVSMAWPNNKKAPDEYFTPLTHPITGKQCPVPAKGWRNPVKTMKELLDKGLILFGEDETTQPRRKYLLRENMNENLPSILYFGGSDDTLFSEIMLGFDNPKPHIFCKQLLQPFLIDKNSIVVDFFSGSATTAHAVMQLNAEDQGKRKYIMVQLPEDTTEESKSYKAGYKNICDIGKERIRRVAKKIKQESKADIDYGFRVYQIDSTNMKDVYFSPEQLKQQELFNIESNIKEDRTDEDLLVQIMLECGLEMSLPMEIKEIQGKKVHFVAGNSLVACFDKEVPEEVIKVIAKEKPLRVVFRDSSFKNDADRINVEELFKILSTGTDIKVI